MLSIFLFQEVEFIIEPAATLPDILGSEGYYFTVSTSGSLDYYYFEEKEALLVQVQFVFQQYVKPYDKKNHPVQDERMKFDTFFEQVNALL